MHLGSTSKIAAVLAHIINFIIPTRLIDQITSLIVKRPLATGLKIALVWGLSMVIAQKPKK
jgi:hypothetical protein